MFLATGNTSIPRQCPGSSRSTFRSWYVCSLHRARQSDLSIQRIGPSKTDRALRDLYTSAIESPPPSPKSIRPPLPIDIEKELRLACARLAQGTASGDALADNRQARREKRAHSISQLQQGIARSATSRATSSRPPVPQLPKLSTQNAHIPQRQAVSAHANIEPSSDHMPWSPDSIGVDQRTLAMQQRVNEIMTTSAFPPSAGPWLKPAPHHRSKSTSQAHLAVNTSKSAIRPIITARGDSMDTTHSAINSDMTDDRVTTSTGMTSAIFTPARASRRTSSQALNNHSNENSAIPRFENVQTDDMRETLDKHRRRQEQHDDSSDYPTDSYTSSHPVETLFNTATTASTKTDRSRKRYTDLAAVRAITDRFDRSSSRDASRNEDSAPRTRQLHSSTGLQEPMSRHEPRSAVEERAGRSTMRERATRAARSLSRGLRKVSRSASRQREPEQLMYRDGDAHDARETHRSETPLEKKSFDISRRNRFESRESLPAEDTTQASRAVPTHAAPSKWDPFPRPGSNTEKEHLRPVSAEHGAQRNQVSSPAVNLNRKLPPLPSLQSWEDVPQVEKPTALDTTRTVPAPLNLLSAVSAVESIDTSSMRHPSPMVDTTNLKSKALQPNHLPSPAPWPEMSATFVPGDIDFHAPLRTPSPCSESSLKDFAVQQRKNTRPSMLSVHPVVPNDEDDIDFTLTPVSPKMARMISSLPVTNLKPQIVEAVRRPSSSPKPPTPPRKDSRQSLELSRPKTGVRTDSQQNLAADLSIEGLIHGAHPRNESRQSSADSNQITSLQSMIEASSKPTILLRQKTKKHWFIGKKKRSDWMADVEASGSRSGVLVLNDAAAAPVVKY